MQANCCGWREARSWLQAALGVSAPPTCVSCRTDRQAALGSAGRCKHRCRNTSATPGWHQGSDGLLWALGAMTAMNTGTSFANCHPAPRWQRGLGRRALCPLGVCCPLLFCFVNWASRTCRGSSKARAKLRATEEEITLLQEQCGSRGQRIQTYL